MEHSTLSIRRQCILLELNRSDYYYRAHNKNEDSDIEMLAAILKVLEKKPFYGYRKIALEPDLKKMGATRKIVRRIMNKCGLMAIYPKKNLSRRAKGHKIYPYLLRGKSIWLPNQVWATDITYLKLEGKDIYLTAIIDLYSRRVLSWRISNTMDVSFCIEALEEAIMHYGVPAIFNTDQGSQYTSEAFTSVLKKHNIAISMDGKGRALDNVYVERLWRSVKYEEIYLKDYQSMGELKESLNRYFLFYNSERFHQSLDYETPDDKYFNSFVEKKVA